MIFRILPGILSILAICSFLGLQSDVLRKDFYQSEVNWSKYRINLKTETVIPRIEIHDGKSSANISTPTANNLNEARNIAYRNAHSRNRSRMSLAIERLILDEDYTVGEYMEEHPKIKSQIIQFFNNSPEHENISYNKNKLILISGIPILGSKNLMSVFFSELGGESMPEIYDDLPQDDFTGLVIDARGMNYRPSLFPKIQNEEGRDFYSRSIANPERVLDIGLVGYAHETKGNSLERRVGKNPYYVIPMKVLGKNKTNIVLSNEEISKIFSSSSSKRNLVQCKIVILVDELDR